jgi:DNA polymerase-3 subunit delta
VRLKPGEVEAFLRRPDPQASTILLYGPDEGLVAERALRLLGSVVDDPRDPFRVAELEPELVRSEPGRLVEEAQAFSLMGGRRVVRVRGAGEGIAAAVTALLALPQVEALVLLQAGELAAASKLRGMVERSPRAVALPCYHDEDRDLAGVIREELQRHGLRADQACIAHLVQTLGADRGVTRAEIAKLAAYVGPGTDRAVTVADVDAVVGDASVMGIDDAIAAVLLNRPAALERDLERLQGEGVAAQQVLRALARQLLRLLRMRLELDAGAPLDAVLARARPPIHFRTRPVVEAALRGWSATALATALAAIREAIETAAFAPLDEQLVCRRALAALCDERRRTARSG